MKRLITWLYRKYVGEIYIPPYDTFSVGMKCEAANAKIWNSFLPEVLSLRIKTDKGWKDFVFEK